MSLDLELELASAPMLGAIYNPVHDERFAAHFGLGVTPNGVSVRVQETERREAARIGEPVALSQFAGESAAGE